MVVVKIAFHVTGNFSQFPNWGENGEFMGFVRVLNGISQTGKMLPKPILGFQKPIIYPNLGLN